MDSLLTCCDSSSMAGSHLRLTISSLATTSTEARTLSRPSFCSWHTKSSLRRISSFLEVTTSVDRSTVSTDSMMSASVATPYACGRNSRMFSTACQSLRSSMIKFYACTVASAQSSSLLHNCSRLRGPRKCQRTVYSAT